ncbi:MAG: hypothetical protein Q4F69_11625 [Bacteroidia bacterium]|nr:hypothetical protein [Bacteroidia bacterium]
MTYQIRSTPMFDRQFKALYKKYPSLKNDVARLFAEIQNNPKIGTLLFDDVYKVRMSITSKTRARAAVRE